MIAMLAYLISARAAAASSATPDRSRLAGRAGTARITASASTVSGACAEPTVSRQPSGVRASSRTIAPARTVAPDAPASAAGKVPSPPAIVVNTGDGPPAPAADAPADGGGSSDATAAA